MGRKLLMRHLNEVAATPPPELSNLHSPDEGIIAFTFCYAKNGQSRSCKLKLLALDTDEYPDGNTYMLFTDDDSTDKTISSRLEVITAVLMGKPLTEALAEVSQALQVAVTSGQAGNPIKFDSSDQEKDNEDSGDDMGEYDIDDLDFGFDDGTKSTGDTFKPALASRPRSGASLEPAVDVRKIKADLKAVKGAGFRVGVYGSLTSGGIVCVSIRVTKLGISEEAMQAWGLRRSHYFVLMIRFLHGYRDLETMRKETTLTGQIEMRVALCEHYKPSRDDALTAFGQKIGQDTSGSTSKLLEQLFIASPLNELLRDRFPKIVTFRESYGFNWPSAEAFVYEVQGKAASTMDEINVDDYYLEDDTVSKALPNIVKADALHDQALKHVSLPLVAMQFALRHLVRCTEFCLVCHCKLKDTFEALKPYVCSSPLCLFQYMTLGFGPRIEWEILSQPHVVDLLISFCYSAAQQGRLKEFPVGIDLKVPILPRYSSTLSYGRYGHVMGTSSEPASTLYDEPSFSAKIDYNQQELLLEPDEKSKVSHLRVGDWLVICNGTDTTECHYRILETMFPVLRLSVPLKTARTPINSHQPSRTTHDKTNTGLARSKLTESAPEGFVPVKCYTYERHFDGLNSNEKHHAVILLLDALPSVKDLRTFLKSQTGHDSSLKAWRNGIPDSSLNLLRWIIASNRSCIMQVDSGTTSTSKKASVISPNNDRVIGMPGWMQFRFAQGAPDKEQRFVDSVKEETVNTKFPTFFAWHGSPVGNWHSIIRQGLRYDEALHGRAYGNGVYMSNMASTSMGYSAMGGYGPTTWPGSSLIISNALSLQEVVNKPDQFVSRSPHYVVANIDWIQTRYLFVQCSEERDTSEENLESFVEYAQDNNMTPTNETGQAIRIPITAVSKSRRPAVTSASKVNGTKRSKSLAEVDQATAEQLEDDANSIVSDMEDLAWLSESSGADSDDPFPDDEGYLSLADEHTPNSTAPPSLAPSKKRIFDPSLTNFRPGALDLSNIKFLDPPTNASPLASKALLTAFNDALKIQNSTPAHELGWYIDPDRFDNMYQWIVELHSFPAHLPLTKDMKAANVASIVLEMRFTNSFPFSPPFIRVVKPRFLPFNQGGGGHVTEGGAICMELLTNSGWSAVTSMEAVLLQVQLAMGDEERPARLLGVGKYKGSGGGAECYGVGEAVAAYERACRAHGWQVPEGFTQFAGMG